MTTRACAKCAVEKPMTLDFFNKDSSVKSGLRTVCKLCQSKQARRWQAANSEKVRAAKLVYRSENSEKVAAYDAQYRSKNADKIRARKISKYDSETSCSRALAWQAKNPEKVLAVKSSRRAKKQSASPLWLTKEHKARIKLIYRQAKVLTKITGIEHHVDHIVPLKGKSVSGLHVPWNLRAIPASVNFRKKNRVPTVLPLPLP